MANPSPSIPVRLPAHYQSRKASPGECSPLTLLFPQYVVVCLVLKAMRSQQRGAEMFAQRFHAVALNRIAPQPHPNEVNAIRHQAVGHNKPSRAATWSMISRKCV
jgi:hypothetical protein